MNASFPTRFQSKTLWSAITLASSIAIGAMIVGLVWLVTWLIGFLQPILLPLAVAGVITYLLYPLVDRLSARGVPQKRASLIVFVVFMLGSGLAITAVAIPAAQQAGKLIKTFPRTTDQFERIIGENIDSLRETLESNSFLSPLAKLLPATSTAAGVPAPEGDPAPPASAEAQEQDQPPPAPEPADPPGGAPPPTGPAAVPATPEAGGAGTEPGIPPPPPAEGAGAEAFQDPEEAGTEAGAEPDPEAPVFTVTDLREWLGELLPAIGEKAWFLVKKSVGGFLGAFGFIIGFFLVPIYLFFFLREAPSIQDTWSDYVPIKASSFKDEVVGTLTDINGYLIAFFRGQMLVSLIDGLITAVLLSVLGLKFGLVIGLFVGILGIIPYLGIMMCYIPAVIIATVQGAANASAAETGGERWEVLGLIPIDAPWWVLPLLVTAVFLAVNNLDGILIAPKIVGDSVGLHPFTVIFSVLFWSFLLGGLLGAVLAVPLTASVKVLFHRYLWSRRHLVAGRDGPPDESTDPDKPAGAVA